MGEREMGERGGGQGEREKALHPLCSHNRGPRGYGRERALPPFCSHSQGLGPYLAVGQRHWEAVPGRHRPP